MSIISYARSFEAPSLARQTDSAVLLDRLKSFHPQAIDLSLDRVKRLLAALGHPERRLPPVVHVAGTNGKGSVLAFVRAIAEAQGLRVHAYTSPHLIDFHERISLAGPNGSAPISEEGLVECLLRAEKANGGQPITHFEITTAAAFLAFSEVPADILLLETGMGGRLDASNVVERPRVTAITPVSIDHVGFLGSTLSSIASEKAGILKPGTPCIVGRQEPEAMAVIKATAEAVGARLHVLGRDFDVFERDGRLIFQSATRLLNLPLPCLQGMHQIDNAGSAVALAIALFDDGLTVRALDDGLSNAVWPARLQRLGWGNLNAYVGDKTEILLDGGHNTAGGAAVARYLEMLDRRDPREVHLIWGMMETKDALSVLNHFKGSVSRIYTVPIPGEENAFCAGDLAKMAQSQGFNVTPARGLTDALMLSQAAMREPGRVLIFGSLYLAGHVLKLHAGPGLSPVLRSPKEREGRAGVLCEES
jgi:dihydrofolate synthase/folylpolyglutamate synthase